MSHAQALYGLPKSAPGFNLRTLGNPAPARVVAPAPRASADLTPERVAHVLRLLGACLTVESSARFLAATPRFSGQLQYELGRLSKQAKEINERLLAEFSTADAHHVDTLNRASTLLDRLSLLLLHVPPEVADEAASAAADVIEQHNASTFNT